MTSQHFFFSLYADSNLYWQLQDAGGHWTEVKLMIIAVLVMTKWCKVISILISVSNLRNCHQDMLDWSNYFMPSQVTTETISVEIIECSKVEHCIMYNLYTNSIQGQVHFL